MIQILAFAIALISCRFAFAADPKPGDFSEERRTFYYKAHEPDVIDVRIAVIRYDSATQTVYWQQQTRTNGGPPEIFDDSSSLEDFIDLRMAGADTYQNCAKYNGTIETITVPAGTFSACKTVQHQYGKSSSTWWTPDVPKGYVRIKYHSETLDTDYVLTSYK